MESPILVIGRQGQLAGALQAVGGEDVVCFGRPEADLSKPETIAGLIDRIRPRAVINAGGFTKVDLAETCEAEAFALNRDGPGAIARLCESASIPFVHISTDCVFDGKKASPYEVDDEPRPLNVYGWSKLAGEEAVASSCRSHLIVRISWVFSEYAENFVRTMLNLARDKDQISVVSDQVGYPSYCPDIASGLLEMVRVAQGKDFNDWGIYHLAGRQETDRASMAAAILAESRALGGPSAAIHPVLTRDYSTPATRPLNARLGSGKTEEIFGVSLPDWKIGLHRTVGVILGRFE